MDRTNLKMWARAVVPEAKAQNVPNALLESILQEGADDVASLCDALPTNQKFSSTADTLEYSLSSVVTRFLKFHRSGLWWNNGTQYKQLWPITLKWLDENFRNWRDREAGEPLYFYQEGNTLGVFPKPTETVSDALWLYFYQKPDQMTAEAHYPFGKTTEISRLSILSHNILDYWKWRGNEILGKQELAAAFKKIYLENCMISKARIEENQAVAHGRRTKKTGPRVGC